MKKILFILICFCLLESKVIKDFEGNDIKIPEKVERATPMIGAFVQMSAMLGQQEKIISGSSRLPKMMSKIFPKIRTLNDISGMLGSGVEEIIASKTQVVFGPTSIMFDENQVKQLNDAGITVIRLDKFGTIEQIKACVSKIAEIFGGESIQKAIEFNEYFDNNVKLVLEKTKNLKDKKRVLVLNFNSGNFYTIDSRDIGAEYIRVAGGLNLTDNQNFDSFKISKIINEEQVVIFNPDIIITNSSEGKEQILKNSSFKFLKAIKNSQIYIVPSGVYLWSVRSAEGALQPLWLAKIFYPDLFNEINLEDEIIKFYLKFYNYELSHDEARLILNPETVKK